jgi:membrane-associated phospholipid phosphatase
VLKRARWLGILGMLWSLPAVSAAPGGEHRNDEAVKRFYSQLWSDQKTIFTAPARKSVWETPPAWIMVGLSGASFALDDGPSRELRENPDFRHLNDVFSSGTTGVALTAYPIAMLAAGAAFDQPGLSSYGRRTTRAALNAILAGLVIKAATQRSRPHTGRVYGFWEGGNAFYSGHSTVAWALAAATVRHYPDRRWVPWVAYPLAGVIAFSRVTSGNHFASDAVVGSVTGFAIGRWVE